MDNTPILYSKQKNALLGALVGDSIGSYLELNKLITQKDVEQAFKLPGGTIRKLGKGQLTDDGEMTLSLLSALADSKSFSLDAIASSFGLWFQSKPFDVGNTIRNAIPKTDKGSAELCKKAANKHNQNSQSNGSLMFMVPMAIYLQYKDYKEIDEKVRSVTELIHPQEIVKLCNIFYVLTIVNLLNGLDRINAYNKTKEYMEGQYKNNETLWNWVEEIEQADKRVPANRQVGWIRIAFTYSFGIFLENLSYQQSLQKMLLYGGDTDTNCCILGGLIGAITGVDGYENKIMSFEGRPKYLLPKYILDEKLEKLMHEQQSQ